jgi:hypothetical protein
MLLLVGHRDSHSSYVGAFGENGLNSALPGLVELQHHISEAMGSSIHHQNDILNV